jgi:hypothetical protein
MRPLEPATKTAIDKPVLPLAVVLYLDVENDPLFAWTGIGDLPFLAAETGDPSLDGKTFKGTGTIMEVGQISEGAGGSDALEITLPGVDIAEPMMRQIIRDRQRWQFRRAVVWLMALNEDTFAIEGKPFRIKTGRMDGMPYSENNSGSIKLRIEGQAAYGNDALYTRYSEQLDINPADTSQKYVHSLANMTAELGKSSASSPAANAAIAAMAGGGGFIGTVARAVS